MNSDSTTLEQVMQQEMSKETRQAERRDVAKEGSKEQMLSGGIGPVAGSFLENDRCSEFHRNLQSSNAKATSSFASSMEGHCLKKIDQAAEARGCATVHWRTCLTTKSTTACVSNGTRAAPSCHESARVEQSGGHSGCQLEDDALTRQHGCESRTL